MTFFSPPDHIIRRHSLVNVKILIRRLPAIPMQLAEILAALLILESVARFKKISLREAKSLFRVFWITFLNWTDAKQFVLWYRRGVPVIQVKLKNWLLSGRRTKRNVSCCHHATFLATLQVLRRSAHSQRSRHRRFGARLFVVHHSHMLSCLPTPGEIWSVNFFWLLLRLSWSPGAQSVSQLQRKAESKQNTQFFFLFDNESFVTTLQGLNSPDYRQLMSETAAFFRDSVTRIKHRRDCGHH